MEDRAISCLIALRRVLSAADQNVRALAKATGLSVQQLIVLQIIEDMHEITPMMIARRAGVAPATATALIEKLAQLGYLDRRRSEVDRRKYWVSLTEAGIRALHSAPDPLHQKFSETFSAIPDYEQAMILASLERVADLVSEPSPALARHHHAQVLEVSGAMEQNGEGKPAEGTA